MSAPGDERLLTVLNKSGFTAVVFMSLFLLVGTGFVRYFPPHVKTMYDRATYYWSGDVSLLADSPGTGF